MDVQDESSEAEMETVAVPHTGGADSTLSCQVRWRRSRSARRISLRIDPCVGAVVVVLPLHAKRRAGISLLTTHAAWVAERLASLAPASPFKAGYEVQIGGMPYVIRHDPTARRGVQIRDGALIVAGAAADLPLRIEAFLRAEARRRIAVLVDRHAASLKVTALIKATRIKDTRSRWGSCTYDGTLSFSWRLVMAPSWILDYVVAHEVAHLRLMDHSDRFWAYVDKLTPHAEAAVAWLRQNGPSLLRAGTPDGAKSGEPHQND